MLLTSSIEKNAYKFSKLLSMNNESYCYLKYITQSVVFQKYPFTRIPENSWSENLGKTRVGFSFLKSRKLQNCNFTERDTLAEVCSTVTFRTFFRTVFFSGHLWLSTFGLCCNHTLVISNNDITHYFIERLLFCTQLNAGFKV